MVAFCGGTGGTVGTVAYGTGKSLSEALIFASTNPQYDNRSFIEFQVHYMKIPRSNLGRTCCVQKLFRTFRTIFAHNMFSPCSAKRRASDKDLPVLVVLVGGADRDGPPCEFKLVVVDIEPAPWSI
jgi:hypothetical protein